MQIDLEGEDSRSSKGSGRTPRHSGKGKRKITEREQSVSRGTATTPTPSSPAATRMDETASISEKPTGCGLVLAQARSGGGGSTPPGPEGAELQPAYRSRKGTPCRPLSCCGFPLRNMYSEQDIEFNQGASSTGTRHRPLGGGPPDGGQPRVGPQDDDHPEVHRAVDSLEDPQMEDAWPDCWERTSGRAPGGGSCTPRGRSKPWSARSG